MCIYYNIIYYCCTHQQQRQSDGATNCLALTTIVTTTSGETPLEIALSPTGQAVVITTIVIVVTLDSERSCEASGFPTVFVSIIFFSYRQQHFYTNASTISTDGTFSVSGSDRQPVLGFLDSFLLRDGKIAQKRRFVVISSVEESCSFRKRRVYDYKNSNFTGYLWPFLGFGVFHSPTGRVLKFKHQSSTSLHAQSLDENRTIFRSTRGDVEI